MRTRLFFQATPKTMKASLKAMEGDLSDYAAVAAQYLDQHDLDLRRSIVALENVIEKLTAYSAFHATQVEDLAGRLDPADPQRALSPSDAAQELRYRARTIQRDTETALDSVRREIAAAEERLRGKGSTDPSTGLLNAGEMTRQIETYRTSGITFSLLRFELRGSVTEAIMKQAACKIEKQFRHRDRIARWSETELLVLFQGPPEVAEVRATQVAQLLGGRYELATGGSTEIMVQSELADQESIAA
jgi:hypothetical protein